MAGEKCDCKEWEIGSHQVTAAFMLSYNHGGKYTGTAFKYCPWCGKVLS